jgi:hypothetical protein
MPVPHAPPTIKFSVKTYKGVAFCRIGQSMITALGLLDD